jgi:hypothetical protein
MSDLTFHGVWRMDWGFGNPNKTAAFIAILMVAIWILAYIRKWGFWVALTIFSGLGIALLHTMSRGGLVALCAGLIPLLFLAPRPWKKSRMIGILVGFWLILGVSVFLKTHDRYIQSANIEDRSISNRLQIWKATAAMMANAPDGWGLGNSGKAYMQWYQPLDKGESYRTLVNSHLTWLVEFNWPMRFLYILGWSLVFLICWPSSRARWRSVALGVWVCFFVAAFFSSVAEASVMWAVPGIFLLAALIGRLITRQFPTPLQWSIPFGATAVVSCLIWLSGRQAPPIQKLHQSIIYGQNQTPKTLVIYDSSTMGTLYGRAIRISCKSPVEIALSGTALPSLKDRILVIGGELPDIDQSKLKASIQECQNLVLLNPKFFPQEIGITESNKSKVITYFGDFSQSPSVDTWQTNSTLRHLSGVGDFIPNWPTLISEHSPDYGKR